MGPGPTPCPTVLCKPPPRSSYSEPEYRKACHSRCGPQVDGADVGGALRARRRDGRADALRRRPEQARAARPLQRVRSRGVLVRALELRGTCRSSLGRPPTGFGGVHRLMRHLVFPIPLPTRSGEGSLVSQQNGARDRRRLLKVRRVRLRSGGEWHCETGRAFCAATVDGALVGRCVSRWPFSAGVRHEAGTARLGAVRMIRVLVCRIFELVS